MFSKTVNFKYLQAMLTAFLLCSTLSVFASKYDTHVEELYSTVRKSTAVITNPSNTIKSTPNSFVVLDFSKKIAESWDNKNKPSNMVAHCINGDLITGFEYFNIKIETVGRSFFSEAEIVFSDSSAGENNIILSIGSINETFGTAVFNSNGISDITDLGHSDVASLADKKFIMQFYETIDDRNDEIDARYTDGLLKIWGINLTGEENCPFISSTQGIANADLSVEYNLTAAKSLIGDSISFDIIVTNSGVGEATTVVLENTLSPNLQFVQLTCDDGTSVSSPDPISSVNVINIPAAGILNCALSATISSSGSIQSTVNVTASNDLDVTNNSAAIVFAGANVIPINNSLALLLLIFGLLLFAKKFTRA